ncbi:cysteine hydrolase family protein [Dermabacter jinjuensis]|uniref:Hydrolase n=1 Tax=Dermabacter jinjuensis TaxID=1667168 RepID=A0ABM6PK25_9MICO|nr:isochorismatase family protein [Dermabacter jinjuensis]ATH95771.1 hydrolase [Dermabacter jinjuensis]
MSAFPTPGGPTSSASSRGGAGDKASKAWLLVIDPQVIFAEQSSDWASPMWEAAWANIARLAEAFEGRVILTRWVPTADRSTSWGEYFEAWPFADVPASDPLYDLTPEAAALGASHVISEPTFGKWGAQLTAITGGSPRLVVAGVSTDCCVISTVLPAADSGAWITLVSDACAGSDQGNHERALSIMRLFAPQVRIATTNEVLSLG